MLMQELVLPLPSIVALTPFPKTKRPRALLAPNGHEVRAGGVSSTGSSCVEFWHCTT